MQYGGPTALYDGYEGQDSYMGRQQMLADTQVNHAAQYFPSVVHMSGIPSAWVADLIYVGQ
jgi:hypothetical protein